MGQGVEYQGMQMVPEAEEVVGSVQQSDTTRAVEDCGHRNGHHFLTLQPLRHDHSTNSRLSNQTSL